MRPVLPTADSALRSNEGSLAWLRYVRSSARSTMTLGFSARQRVDFPTWRGPSRSTLLRACAILLLTSLSCMRVFYVSFDPRTSRPVCDDRTGGYGTLK